MPIWVDADALPIPMRDMLFRAAARTGIELILVANRPLPRPSLPNIRAIQVPSGFDVADNYIAAEAGPGDLVITQDIPLAAEVIEKGAAAISPRGELFNPENIRARLNIRDFMDTMRSSAMAPSGGPPPLGTREKQAFANALDCWLAANKP
ncbi:MAG TPA: YaiI/YqxD family protein [Pseudomonadales bacterium]